VWRLLPCIAIRGLLRGGGLGERLRHERSGRRQCLVRASVVAQQRAHPRFFAVHDLVAFNLDLAGRSVVFGNLDERDAGASRRQDVVPENEPETNSQERIGG
jgi:hypothetical protein